MNYWQGKRAVVTGGTAGLGRVVADVLVQRGARVAIVARNQSRLDAAVHELRARGGDVLSIAADVTDPTDVDRLTSTVQSGWGGVDMLCNCAGQSMRGTVLATPASKFEELWQVNVLSALRCTQAFAPSLEDSHGHIVLVGSLASKVAAGYLGAYPATKFPLAALAQQLRMELGEGGPHVLFVCPGPIAREAGPSAEPLGRYADPTDELPAEARKPGGGAKVRAIDPIWLSGKILDACQSRKPELIVPQSARLLFAVSQLSPRLGDWLLRRMTSG